LSRRILPGLAESLMRVGLPRQDGDKSADRPPVLLGHSAGPVKPSREYENVIRTYIRERVCRRTFMPMDIRPGLTGGTSPSYKPLSPT